jgi:Ca-activated chloride channel family protein
MIFRQPSLLLGLFVVAFLAAGYVLARRRRQKFALRFSDVALLKAVAGQGPQVRKHIPPVLYLLGASLLVVGMAQPYLNLEVARHDASVMLVIDVSGSMQATDVQPTRLEAAQQAARNLIHQLPSDDRVGLVSFNTAATLAAPLSDNHDTVLNAVDGLQALGGTAIGDALALAVQQLQPAAGANTATRSPALIVLLTDGVSNAGIDPLTAAASAKSSGIPVDTIGVGSHDPSVSVHGRPVGGVDEVGLGAIATTTGGKYYFAEAAGQLNQIYSTLGSQFGWRFLRLEITIPLVVIGTLLVVAAAVASLAWFRVLP